MEPAWFNAPVPTFGDTRASLLVVGLAPGLRGANRTGRPFTGDYAGELLYATLLEYGFATGTYDQRADDGLVLNDCAITNAVRCVPPENKPLPVEITTCRAFLTAVLENMADLRALVVLRRSAVPFVHGRRHAIDRPQRPTLAMFDSYHCSRYNTSTRLLTEDMFRAVFRDAKAWLATADTDERLSRS